MPFGATITGIGSYVPEQRLTNEDLSKLVETNDEWILTRTGIRERRIAPSEEGASHLAARAGAEALADAGLEPGDVDLIIVATATPDLVFPPVACLVQGALGATRAAAFDLNGVCAGFLFALTTGAQFIQTGAYRHVLVIGAETFSRLVNYKDRATCILFGDGAGAVLLSRTEAGYGLLDFTLHADGAQAGLIYCPSPTSPSGTLEAIGAKPDYPYFTQDGRAVFKLAVNGMAGAVQSLLDRQGLTVDDLTVLVPHQANQRIMGAVAEKLKLPEDRVANCIADFGNTSAATIPMALHDWLQRNALKDGDLVAVCAFAGGLLWGAALLRWGGAAGGLGARPANPEGQR
jgi:3-oxoacyl-[acyl-carrier-protein] synthase III